MDRGWIEDGWRMDRSQGLRILSFYVIVLKMMVGECVASFTEVVSEMFDSDQKSASVCVQPVSRRKVVAWMPRGRAVNASRRWQSSAICDPRNASKPFLRL